MNNIKSFYERNFKEFIYNNLLLDMRVKWKELELKESVSWFKLNSLFATSLQI